MRLGIIGCGMIAGLVGPHLSEWGFDVTAVAGTPRSSSRTLELATKVDAASCYDDWCELLSDENVDAAYVAVPNALHHEIARRALLMGKDVICEKPLASNGHQARELARLARTEGHFLWEAITTTRQPNFLLLRDNVIPLLGDVRLATVCFCKRSSRYEAFLAGSTPPAFDPAQAGGALMDLGVYALSFVLGLFGKPHRAGYVARVERGIDTSGTILLSYDGFSVSCSIGKDCDGANGTMILGTEGRVVMEEPPNVCSPIRVCLRGGSERYFDRSLPLMWEAEFREIAAQWDAGDLASCNRRLDETLAVCEVMDTLRRDAGVLFPSDDA